MAFGLVVICIASVLVALIGAATWLKVAELKYGTNRELEVLSAKLYELEDKIDKIDVEKLRKLQDDVSTLKVRSAFK